MKLSLLAIMVVLSSNVSAKTEASAVATENPKRGLAQAGAATVRNILRCTFGANEMELKSIEIFGAVGESAQKPVVSDVHSLVEGTAHGGMRMIYKGGVVSVNGGELVGSIVIAGTTFGFEYKAGTFSLPFNGKIISAKKCNLVVQ